MARRLVQLYVGLVLYGVGCAMIILAGLGNDPWDVFHQGLARHSNLGIGVWTIIISGVVLLLWIPLKVRPGIGTISNAFIVGIVMQVVLDAFHTAHALPIQLVLMLAGVLVVGLATGLYIGADFGPGPRDGLMTGIAARGLPIFAVRTSLEVSVLVAGWLLDGTVGVGTVVFALGIGPIVHFTLPLFETRSGAQPQRVPAALPLSQTAP